ncbi:MAG: type II toxin-antitoxin system RelE/ParE family toxin [Proteobacteria bacterium]|nr:type II toxin-antitoxin system RelE/ParE family toxin [Pseudomonadota bacterium]
MPSARRNALWSPEALDDRERIWTYYVAIAGNQTAENILRELGRVIALIEEHPFAGRARDEIRPGLRSFATGPHVLFYRVVDNTPQIMRVLDGSKTLRSSLRETTGYRVLRSVAARLRAPIASHRASSVGQICCPVAPKQGFVSCFHAPSVLGQYT